jgi:hypothetical protein
MFIKYKSLIKFIHYTKLKIKLINKKIENQVGLDGFTSRRKN